MRLEDVCFAYGDRLILNHFSLELTPLGVTALSGPSGCGKTTLLRLLAGLEQPQSGRISAPLRGQTAMLFQENRLFPGLTARQQLQAVLPRGEDPLPWLARVELDKAAELYPEVMSGGMQRRLALARCMAYGRDKALLLLDEPFTGVDPQRIRALMEQLRQMQLPVVYTAHDAESLALADRRILLEGAPLAVVE